ncbi:MAG TPA: hypothetical protein VGX70_00830 [Gemmataceae bacterium]|jgi:hypothetical protein|nr:hypothetical protein [Gemmataceae bacterium]
MTNIRPELLQVLAELGEECPEMRMGQLIANLATLAKGATIEAIWDVEDNELLSAGRRQLEFFRSRKSSVA